MAGQISSGIKFGLLSIAVGAMTVASDPSAHAVPLGLSRGLLKVIFHPEGELAKVPKGWKQFCHDRPAECRVDASHEPITPELTEARLEELERVNTSVNRHVRPMTDMRNYGVSERWTYPDNGRGDCEDFALLKRRKLMELGWPRESLLITIVWSGNEGHSVLTAHTDRGDYVLDNQSSKVLPWNKTRYDYVKRQSRYNQNQWVYIDGKPATRYVDISKPKDVVVASVKPEAPVLATDKSDDSKLVATKSESSVSAVADAAGPAVVAEGKNGTANSSTNFGGAVEIPNARDYESLVEQPAALLMIANVTSADALLSNSGHASADPAEACNSASGGALPSEFSAEVGQVLPMILW